VLLVLRETPFPYTFLPHDHYHFYHTITIISTTLSLSFLPHYHYHSTTLSLSFLPHYHYHFYHTITIISTTLSLSFLLHYHYHFYQALGITSPIYLRNPRIARSKLHLIVKIHSCISTFPSISSSVILMLGLWQRCFNSFNA
jgi:hypothetical protein